MAAPGVQYTPPSPACLPVAVLCLIAAGMQGGWVWSWKDRIDRAFMEKFGSDLDFAAMQGAGGAGGQQQQLSAALEASLSAEELAVLAGAKMRCGGCGSKVGATSLGRVLQRLQQAEAGADVCSSNGQQEPQQGRQGAAAVVLGLREPDDAAVLEPPPPGHVTVSCCAPFLCLVTALPFCPHCLPLTSP